MEREIDSKRTSTSQVMYQQSISIDMKRWALSSPNHCGNQQQVMDVVKTTIFLSQRIKLLIYIYNIPIKKKYISKLIGECQLNETHMRIL